MPLRGSPTCLKCKTNESPLWTNAENLGAICLNCVNETKQTAKLEQQKDEEEQKDGTNAAASTSTAASTTRPKRKTRLTRKGRRSLFKRTPMKAPTAVATPVTSNSVFYKGSYFQIGDIVSMIDQDGDTYYAQIHGLLTDQYCEKSACVTWLLPTKHSPSPKVAFDPATYIIGPEEDIPRKLEAMEFIMHAPSDYYKAKNTPYPPVHAPATPGYIWKSLHVVQR